MPPSTTLSLVLAGCGLASGFWDRNSGEKDPMTAAMEMSRMARLDPDIMKKDPNHFKKMFGRLAMEQSQAQNLDKAQHVSKEDRCLTCHGMVVEVEKILAARIDKWRNEIAITEALEEICNPSRYQQLDPDGLNPTMRTEGSRRYFGLDPFVFSNACNQVLIEWGDDDEIEVDLKRGAPAADMHRKLRESVCGRRGGVCHKLGVEVDNDGESLFKKDIGAPKCDAEGGTKKKKKKKKQTKTAEGDPITMS